MFLKIFLVVISCFLGYIFGSFNFAIFISRKIYRKDIKKLGSKNAGTTNILRNFGLAPAIITLLGDMLKGFLSILVCQLISFKVLDANELVYAKHLVCIFALLGHIFPVFYRFKGGKGICVVAGAIIFIDIKIFLALITIFIVVFKFTKIVSISSIFSAMFYPIIVFFVCFFKNISTLQLINSTIFATITSIILIFAHKDNIRRFLQNKEPRIKK